LKSKGGKTYHQNKCPRNPQNYAEVVVLTSTDKTNTDATNRESNLRQSDVTIQNKPLDPPPIKKNEETSEQRKKNSIGEKEEDQTLQKQQG